MKLFNKGDIVYWCKQDGCRYGVEWGIVDEQFYDVVCIDYLRPKECKLVNGIPKVGFWYCDYNTFTAVMGKHIGIENFCSWCDRFDLIPT